MRVAKSSVVALLLEQGEENVAVLLARSPLPDELDTARDFGALAEFGLDPDDVRDMVQATAATADGVAGTNSEQMERTISRRWAHLVEQWVTG